MFGVGLLGLSILCILTKDFIVGRPPAWPNSLQVNPMLAYLSAALLVICALGIIANNKGGLSAMIVAALILLLSVSRHITSLMQDWLNAYKALALLGGALIIACSFFKENELLTGTIRVKPSTQKILVTVGCILIAIFFIACGYAHFKFVDFIDGFIPAYIPFHTFWTYFTAICLIAGGIGILLPPTRKWAALLSGLMVFGWFLLLHIPRFIANTADASERLGLCESFTFAAIFFALGSLKQKA